MFALSLILLAFAARLAAAEDLSGCLARDVVLSRQAENFSGDAQMKRLIDADLKRAKREAAEGDADECTEALDHATKLLAGGS